MWRPIICPGIRCFQSGIFSLRWLRLLFTFGTFQRWTCRYLLIPLNASIITLRISTTLGGLGLECLQPSLDSSGKLLVSSSCISSSGSVQVSGRTCQQSTQIFDSGGIMLDGGSLAPHSSQHVGRHSSAVSHHKDPIMDVSVGQALKGLQYLHLTIWLLSNVCYADRGSLPQSVRPWWGQLECLHQRSTSSVGRNGQVGVINRVYQTMPSLLLN